MDVIKTRLQTQNITPGMIRDTSDEALVGVKYKDLISAAKTIVKEEGMRCFGKGILPRAIQASMSSALSWVSYEFIKNLFLTTSVRP